MDKNSQLVDLHCHILPGCDDGAQTLTQALALGHDAQQQGIHDILVTPHHMDRQYVNHRADVCRETEKLQAAFNEAHLPIRLHPGQEVHLTGELLAALDQGDLLFTNEQHPYLMLEFPHETIPHYAFDVISELLVRDIIPIIVHPERNHEIQQHPDQLYHLRQMGCLAQLTASSYVGGFGESVMQLTEQFIEAGLGSIFASDAHNQKGRRFVMKEAFAKLTTEFGLAEAQAYQQRAQAILYGLPVESGSFQALVPKKKTFWQKLRGKW